MLNPGVPTKRKLWSNMCSFLYLFVFYSLFCWPFASCRSYSKWLVYVDSSLWPTACDASSVYWHLADVWCLLLEEWVCARTCVWGGGSVMLSPPPLAATRFHPRGSCGVEITTSILAVPSIARMTSSPSPLGPSFHWQWKQSRGEKSLSQRDPLSGGGSVLTCLSFSASTLGEDFALAGKFPH